MKNKKNLVLLIALVGIVFVVACQHFSWKKYTNTEYGFEFKYPPNYQLEIVDKNLIPTNHDLEITLKNGSEWMSITLIRVTQRYAPANDKGWVANNLPGQKDFIIDGNLGRSLESIEPCAEGGCTKKIQVIHKGVIYDISKFIGSDISIEDIANTFRFL